MSYLVLARKYRPQKFSEIIGQEHIVTVLKNAIKSGKIWHAYIFSGPRGTGKTTTARVLAKVLNCLSLSSDYEPCNKCKNCIEITQGNSIDVIEIDAASNRGIDEIRALRENVQFVPVSCKYKVYIIDEAHQITEHAFNAFLKTLEEPPSYVIFIMATTELSSFPLTIISRCQVFQFRPVSTEIIFARLKNILEQEIGKNKIDDIVLRIIAENSSGSVRDALSLLDQVLAVTGEDKVDIETVQKIFGSTPKELIEGYVDTIFSGDLNKVVEYIEKLYNTGVDFLQFTKELIEYFREILFVNLELKRENLIFEVQKYKGKVSMSKLIPIIQNLLRLVEEIKRTEFPKIMFELYSIKLTKQYIDINEIISFIDKISTGQVSNVVVENTGSVLEKEKINLQNVDTLNSKNVNTSTFQEQHPREIIEPLWDEFLAKLNIEKPILYSFLTNVEKVINRDSIVLCFPNKFMKNIAEKRVKDLEEEIKKFFGRKLSISFLVEEGKKILLEQKDVGEEYTKNIKTVPIEPKKTIDSGVEKIIKSFSGRIIEPDGENRTEKKVT